METYTYRAEIEPGEKRSVFVVAFPDVPEAITQGKSTEDARAEAEKVLARALLSYVERGLPLPKARARGRDLVPITVAPDVAAKLAVLEAFAEAGISKVELANRLDVDEKEARRILDPRHPTKMLKLAGALRVLGRRLVVGVEKAA